MRNLWRTSCVVVLVVACMIGGSISSHAQAIVPAGTAVSVTLNESVSSKDARLGQKVDGTLASAVFVDGKTVIPRGARVVLTVTSVQESGRLSTPAKLWLKVRSVNVNGKFYDLPTRWAGRTEQGKGKRDAIGIGGGSVLGAVIGGIAGGGKGAAIGAAAGAGAGTAGAAATGKKDITFPVESKLRFATKATVKID